jgi:hypothetical protein
MYSVKRSGKNGFAFFAAGSDMAAPSCLLGLPPVAGTACGFNCEPSLAARPSAAAGQTA